MTSLRQRATFERQPLLPHDEQSTYPSLPLRSRDRQIRLLDLWPSTRNRKLRGTLRTVSLDSEPQYEALSYAWGQADEGRGLRLHGFEGNSEDPFEASITDNLYAALRRLRHLFRKRTLWVDAICINQTDPAEKGWQVAMMGDIFANARNTLIWLGDAKRILPFTLRPLWYCGPLYEMYLDRYAVEHGYENNGFIHFCRALSAVIRGFPSILEEALLRSWLSAWLDRTWVQQEFILSDQVSICCGSCELQFDVPTLSAVLEMARRCKLNLPAAQDFYERIYDLQGLRERHGHRELDVYTAAARTSRTEATDPRDKIYGLLGLVGSQEAGCIGVDYDLYCAEVYAKATYASILHRGFDILETLAFHHTGHRPTDLPSWSADFSRRRSPRHLRGHNIADAEILRRNSHSFFVATDQTHATHPTTLSQDCRELTILALPLDVVSRAVPRFASQIKRDVDNAILGDLLCSIDKDLPKPRSASTDRREATTSVRAHFEPQSANHALKESDTISSAFRHWDCFSSNLELPLPRGPPQHADRGKAAREDMLVENYVKYASLVYGEAAFMALSTGFVGLALGCVRAGDRLVLAKNARLPLVIRPSVDCWTFQGFAYVHGLSYDELFSQWLRDGKKAQEFVLR